MINENESPVEWAMLLTELDDAKEHLESLIKSMTGAGIVDESEFSVQLGHVFAHLNRAWNSRDLKGQIGEEQWAIFSTFPKDLDPVG